MNFFTFTCLLAVALAKHETTKKVEEMVSSSSSSSEETAEVSSEKNTITEEEKYYLKQLNKISEFYQKLNPLYFQAFRQHQIVMNPGTHIKTRAIPFAPNMNRQQYFGNEESASISQEQYKQDKDEFMHSSQETTRKTADMESTEVVTEKTKLTEQEKNYLKQMKKFHQYYQKFPVPQYVMAVQDLTGGSPWNLIRTNAYQIVPIMI